MKSANELKQAGFTESGATRYRDATSGYCDELFTKSVALGDRDKASDAPREVTHEHVRSAALVLTTRSQGQGSRKQTICQVGEYVCAALAGVGGGKLDQTWGILLFGLSLTVGVVLFVYRSSERRLA